MYVIRKRRGAPYCGRWVYFKSRECGVPVFVTALADALSFRENNVHLADTARSLGGEVHKVQGRG